MTAVYLDCSATTPVEPRVLEAMWPYLTEEFGNAGSRTHDFGLRAKRATEHARAQVGAVVGCSPDEVIFTSGATESNNLAILGLREYGQRTNRTHVITTQIEHKAVLEPFDALERSGFSVTRLPVDSQGYVRPDSIAQALSPGTLLVSVMHVNNETGVKQPIDEICDALGSHEAFFHTDAAQGFGKELAALTNPRINLISMSGHKLFAPKGVGALLARRRGYERVPLAPLMFGGGQERGIRPGTLPVHLIVALGAAAELAVRHNSIRQKKVQEIREDAMKALASLNPKFTGDQSRVMPHILNVSFPGLDAEAAILALKDLISVSTGSACTSSNYTPSHVLTAMGHGEEEANQCVRLSWSHLTPAVDWQAVAQRIHSVL